MTPIIICLCSTSPAATRYVTEWQMPHTWLINRRRLLVRYSQCS